MILSTSLTEAAPLRAALQPAFTQPTFQPFTLLMAAALLTSGRRTIANLLRTLGPLAPGHKTTCQRVFSAASWSGLRLACLLARFVVSQLRPDGTILLVGDDTVDGHKGKKVYGKARHRDPVRSSHSYTAWRYGHKWVALCVLVRFPFATRPWALPLLVDLYQTAQQNRQRQRPQRTPAPLMCRLLRQMLLWFPQRTFVFVGDAGYGSHEVARFCYRHRARLTLVSKFHPDANLHEPPPPYRGTGRPRQKGIKLPKPRQAAAAATLLPVEVGWYGGGRRRVAHASGVGGWYKADAGLVPIRWVFVRDQSGTHRDAYFFTTDSALTPASVLDHYTSRWNIETTFQELRDYLGLETTRGWCQGTVLRLAPCLFGLYTVAALVYAALPESKRSGCIAWPGKQGVTFSDALTAVRRWLWAEGVFAQVENGRFLEKLPQPLREIIFVALTPAA